MKASRSIFSLDFSCSVDTLCVSLLAEDDTCLLRVGIPFLDEAPGARVSFLDIFFSIYFLH